MMNEQLPELEDQRLKQLAEYFDALGSEDAAIMRKLIDCECEVSETRLLACAKHTKNTVDRVPF